MSSSVILNGGSFASIGTTAERAGQVSYTGHVDNAWEPEDLVATVQFLAQLDERLPPYVLPVSAESAIDFCHVRRNEDAPSDPANAQPVGAEAVFVVDVSRSDSNDAMQEDSAPLEDNSAAQTPCSTEERSIIRATNKPAHLKRYTRRTPSCLMKPPTIEWARIMIIIRRLNPIDFHFDTHGKEAARFIDCSDTADLPRLGY